MWTIYEQRLDTVSKARSLGERAFNVDHAVGMLERGYGELHHLALLQLLRTGVPVIRKRIT